MTDPSNQAQAYLAAIVTSSDDAIISKDLNGNITSWNPSAERIFGFTPEEAVGKHISIIIPHDRLAEEDFIIGKIRAGERLQHFEAVRRHKNGKLIQLSVTVSPIRDGNGTIVGASKVARDVTAEKAAERAQSHLGAIIESSDDAIISKDLRGNILSWNGAAQRLFGYTADEVIGRHITILIPPERQQEEDEIIARIHAGQRVDHFETWRRTKDGRQIPLSITVSPILNGKGEVIGASKVARDISERLQTAASLAEASRKKDDFLANMSHELRTPMNAVIGISHLLALSKTLSEKDRQFVSTLKMSADHLLDLINDLLDFAKIESGAILIEEVEFNLAEEVNKALSVANVKAREKHVALQLHYPPELLRYYRGDPLRVYQVLNNLLSNAVKFTDRGTITLEINGVEAGEKTALTIRVTDTGIGIAPEHLETIFEKFVQADDSITRRYGGSGLGLAITKELAERMGGSISVNSVPGMGSSFTVVLPLVNTARKAEPVLFAVETAEATTETSKNVLLVEDYAPNVLVAGEMLSRFGYDYDVADNGVEAIRKFQNRQYDVILMDVQMHEMDGLEATRRIRKLEEERGLARTPIIAMTAHVREQDKSMCLAAGMDDFIPKPFEPDLLSQKIDQYAPTRNVLKFQSAH